MVPKICSMQECEKPHHSSGYCSAHYSRYKRNGSPDAGQAPRVKGATASQRFFAKVKKTQSCWEWHGAKNDRDGYGRFWLDNKIQLAHRASLKISGVAIPDNLFADHMCHNKSCVNPAHLRIVTKKQNGENHSGGPLSISKSGVRGVHWEARTGKWVAQVTSKGHGYFNARFALKADAESAAIAKRNEWFTHNDRDRIAANDE